MPWEVELLIWGYHFSESLTTLPVHQDSGDFTEFTIELVMSGSLEKKTFLALYMFFKIF